MGNTILLGNGLNLLSQNCPNWNDLLVSMSNNPLSQQKIKHIPYTMRYEMLLPKKATEKAFLIAEDGAFIITEDGASIIVDYDTEYDIRQRMCKTLNNFTAHSIYNKLANLNIQNYITTNYDYTLKNTFTEQLYTSYPKTNETKYSIRRKYIIQSGLTDLCNIWHIHGEINHPNTLMLGLNDYCESISKIDSYINGTYEFESQKIRPLHERMEKNELTDSVSWIDLFFNSSIHIIGLSLDYSEIDLWWLIIKRLRTFKNYRDQRPKNKVIFYGDQPADKEHLFKEFDIEYIKIEVIDGDYISQYEKAITMIEKEVGIR